VHVSADRGWAQLDSNLLRWLGFGVTCRGRLLDQIGGGGQTILLRGIAAAG